ncbi:MAG: hypothetical protein QOH42_1242 [Blastocatellia bacterium]|nr:hypothetical protein [Blastocatellia bacterium]
MPPDVRNASGFPQRNISLVREAMPRKKGGGIAPGSNFELDRKGKAFPHISGKAAALKISSDKFSRQTFSLALSLRG